MSVTIQLFLEKYNIKINNSKFFDEALTHNSYSNENHKSYTYQRMEWLGDAILQMYVSHYFFKKYPNEKEGVLTKYRSQAVREETLSTIAKKIKLGNLIRLGQGELNSKGFEKPSILADVFESLTAAIYLDQGEEKLVYWLQKTLFSYIENADILETIKDYKSELQELLQAEKRHDLKYRVINEEHIELNNKIKYTVEVILDKQTFGRGVGYSKQEAEQEAAKDCLSKLSTKTNK